MDRGFGRNNCITSFSLRRCDSASGSSTADERGSHAASLLLFNLMFASTSPNNSRDYVISNLLRSKPMRDAG
jgi:hypothetical protein